MFAFIEGTVAEKNQNELVLLASGVGYSLTCSVGTLSTAPAVGERFRAYTYLSVREDALELFGFSSREERAMFLRMTNVSGVGPRTALGLLGSMPLRDLTLAILTEDLAALTRAPGIGKKTAQRLVLELKEKVSQADLPAGAQGVSPVTALSEDCVSEALAALQALGYTAGEAARAISLVKDKTDRPDEMVRLALRGMIAGN